MPAAVKTKRVETTMPTNAMTKRTAPTMRNYTIPACKSYVQEVVANLQLEAETKDDLPCNEEELAFKPDSPRRILKLSHTAVNRNSIKQSFVFRESIYFDSKMDIIYFGQGVEEVDAINAINFLAEKEHVQYIACNIYFQDSGQSIEPVEFFYTFHQYKNLKEVIFITNKQNVSKKANVKIGFEQVQVAVYSKQWQSPHLAGIHIDKLENLNGWKVPRLRFMARSDFFSSRTKTSRRAGTSRC